MPFTTENHHIYKSTFFFPCFTRIFPFILSFLGLYLRALLHRWNYSHTSTSSNNCSYFLSFALSRNWLLLFHPHSNHIIWNYCYIPFIAGSHHTTIYFPITTHIFTHPPRHISIYPPCSYVPKHLFSAQVILSLLLLSETIYSQALFITGSCISRYRHMVEHIHTWRQYSYPWHKTKLRNIYIVSNETLNLLTRNVHEHKLNTSLSM